MGKFNLGVEDLFRRASFFCELRESDGSTILYGLCMGDDQSGEVQFRCTKSIKESVLPSYWRVQDG